MRAGVVAPRAEGMIADADFFGFGADADDRHRGIAPPGVKGTVGGVAGDGDGVCRDFTRIIHAEKFALLVVEGMDVVFVE